MFRAALHPLAFFAATASKAPPAPKTSPREPGRDAAPTATARADASKPLRVTVR